MAEENVAGFPPQIQSRSRLTSICMLRRDAILIETAGVRDEMTE